MSQNVYSLRSRLLFHNFFRPFFIIEFLALFSKDKKLDYDKRMKKNYEKFVNWNIKNFHEDFFYVPEFFFVFFVVYFIWHAGAKTNIC